MKKITYLILILCVSALFAENNDNNEKLNFNTFYLKLITKRDKINKTITDDIQIKQSLDGLDIAKVSNKPLKMILKPIMSFYAHPKFPFTILFPKKYIINSVHSFNNNDVSWKYDKNIIDLEAKKSLTEETILVKYSDKKGKKYISNLIIKRYLHYNDGTKIHSVFILTDKVKIDINKILNAYYSKYGRLPNKSDIVEYKGIIYSIIEDNKNGNININKKNFRVEYGIK